MQPRPEHQLGWTSVLVVGHRASGKSTTVAKLAPHYHIIDLDDEITLRSGSSPEEHLVEDAASFRELESETLADLVANPSAELQVIAVGAGCQNLPPKTLIVWLYHQGWETAARDQRNRLRPDLTWEAELAWMHRSREPLWKARAHLRMERAIGERPEAVAERLRELIELSRRAVGSDNARKLWVVVDTDLEEAINKVQTLGLAGVEIRSDIYPDADKLPGLFEILRENQISAITSLRTDDPTWVQTALSLGPVWLDIDISYFPEALRDVEITGNLIISSHPPIGSVNQAYQALMEEIELAQARAGKCVVKYAPSIQDLEELGWDLSFNLAARHPRNLDIIYLPQGERFAFVRHLTLRTTPVQYVSQTLHLDPGAHAGVDWAFLLPSLAGPPPKDFDALIGSPVRHSRGDIWHRLRALETGEENMGYVKIEADEASYHEAISLIRVFGIRGVSITSPLKTCAPILAHVDKQAINTLWRTDFDQWTGACTDTIGMDAALREIEAGGVGPGTAAILGQGGVSSAVLHALEERGWEVVLHASYRQGWPENVRPVDLVVNAAGPDGPSKEGAPQTRVWLDLHYTNTSPITNAEHRIGDTFFVAQAIAQRELWKDAYITDVDDVDDEFGDDYDDYGDDYEDFEEI